MGASTFKALCGKNFGYFPNEHDSPPNSDGEDADDDAAGPSWLKPQEAAVRNTARFMSSVLAKAPVADAVTGRGWGPYLERVPDERGGSHPAIQANKAKVTQPMLDKLKTMGAVHTLELRECGLKEMPPIFGIDGLTVLDVAGNKLTRIAVDKNAPAPKEPTLRKFSADRNKIENISPGILSGAFVAELQTISLAHNLLTFLPRDFCKGAENLKYLDLSNNKLSSVPDSITTCEKLQFILLQHNQLTSLPDEIGKFTELKKLFASYNKLQEIPSSIGECKKLEKVRLANNQIRYLPDTFIELWNMPSKNKHGRLKELMLEGNPLVQPSITAFEMGGDKEGLNRALQLFNDWLEEKKTKEGTEQARSQPALRSGPSRDDFDKDPKMLEDDAATRKFKKRSETNVEFSGFRGNTEDVEDDTEGAPKAADALDHYYFSGKTPAEIVEIRSAESEMLTRKKIKYINTMLLMAKAQEQHALNVGKKVGDLPAKYQKFLDPGFSVMTYDETIPTSDVDLYFNLMVYSMKPLYTNCAAIFDIFSQHGRDEMGFKEWTAMCGRAPVRLPQEVQEQMWQLITSDDATDTLSEHQFIAAFHIHDVADPDPFIKQLAEVQRLDYYDMNDSEMRERLKAKNAAHATLPLNFDNHDGGAHHQLPIRVHLDAVEGERHIAVPKARACRTADGADAAGARKARPVSMTNAQYIESDGGGSSDDGVVGDANSDSLSRSDNSEIDPFDAKSIFDEEDKIRQEEQSRRAHPVPHAKHRQSTANGRRSSQLGDRRSSQLGVLVEPSESAHGPQDSEPGTPRMAAGRGRPQGRRKKETGGPGGKAKDRGYRTDVFSTRVALREAFRNMPLEDFKKLVNFLVRGMKRINELDDDETATYWHVDDPSFRAATGVRRMHVYVRKLMVSMGFVHVGDTYWVWPNAHMQNAQAEIDWGHEAIEEECPGLSGARLHDMITLFQACQRSMAQSQDFNGQIK